MIRKTARPKEENSPSELKKTSAHANRSEPPAENTPGCDVEAAGPELNVVKRDKEEEALTLLEPEGLGPAGPKWQQRKSSQTRVAVLEATIDCLETHGYAQTTMQLIAEVAKISRGAMTHHYASKQELIAAVIDYLFYKRMERFKESIGSLTESERVDQNLGIEMVWENYYRREYRAYLELIVAARSDEELKRIFLPKAQRYDRIWRVETARVFPEWSKADRLELAIDFVEAALEGLVLTQPIWDAPEREATFRAFLAHVMRELRDGRLKVPSKAESDKFRPAKRRSKAKS